MNIDELIAATPRCFADEFTWEGAETILGCQYGFSNPYVSRSLKWSYVRDGESRSAKGELSFAGNMNRMTDWLQLTASRAMDGRVYTCELRVGDVVRSCTLTLTVRRTYARVDATKLKQLINWKLIGVFSIKLTAFVNVN